MDTRIYAVTDSHQEARNLSQLLSGIANFEKGNNSQFLLLDCGDLFKGIYDRDLIVNAYLNFKKLYPQAQIVFALGNNDFGFNQSDFEYLKSVMSKFKKAGIEFICANLTQDKEYSNLCPRYKIINIDDKKILITAFCMQTSVVKRFGYEFKNEQIALQDLINSVTEKYDKIIVLNHHWYPYSKALKDFAQSIGINIDLIIGGHEHSLIVPDYQNNIFYPLAFAKTLFKITLDNRIENITQHNVEEFKIIPEFEKPLTEYEEQTQLYKPFAKRVLNLWKCYSEPCPLGTFISDNMKRIAHTDIAFHSTGFSMYSLSTDDSDVITKYDFERVICASTCIQKIEIDCAQLKKVFENATLRRMYKNNGNARFLQCSQNIKITGVPKPEEKTYKILQIEINGEKLLDCEANPVDVNKKFTCAIDAFIGSGEQGFEVLKDIPKIEILDKNNEPIQLNRLLYDSLKEAQGIYPPNSEYPVFELEDVL